MVNNDMIVGGYMGEEVGGWIKLYIAEIHD